MTAEGHPADIDIESEARAGHELRRSLVIAAVLLVAVAGILGTFGYVLVYPDMCSGLYDVYHYFGPMNYLMDRSLHSGQAPLWNPYVFCGMPYAANPQTAFFYPPNIVRSLLTFGSTPRATHIGLALLMGLHMLLAFCGTFLLGRAHGTSRSGAIAGAIAFTFSAVMVRRVCEYHFITCLAWLPLMLYFLKRALDGGRRHWVFFGGWAGLLFGFSILAGFLQIVAYVGLTAAVYAVGYRLFYWRHASCDGERRRPVLGLIVVLAVFVVAGFTIGAALLAPATELAGHGARQPAENIRQYSNLLRQGPLSLLQDFIVYPGMKYQAEAMRNSGVIALLLSAMGLLMYPRRDRFLFFALYLVLLDCSFGPPFPIATVLTRLVPFSISAHSRAYDVALLPLSILAGFGVDAVLRPLRSNWTRGARTAVLLLLGVALLWALHVWAYPDHWLHVWRVVILAPALGLLAMLICGWIPRALLAGAGLAVLLLVETLAWNAWYVPNLVTRPTEAITSATLQSPMARTLDPKPNMMLYGLRAQITGYDPLHIKSVRSVISGGGRTNRYGRIVADWEPTADNNRGFLFLKRRFWLARQYVDGNLPERGRLYPSATTVFLAASPPDVKRVTEDELPASCVSPLSFEATPAGGASLPCEVDAHRSCSVFFKLPTRIGEHAAGLAGCFHSSLFITYSSIAAGELQVSFLESPMGQTVPGAHITVHATGQGTAVAEVPMPDYPEVTVRIGADKNTRHKINVVNAEVRCDTADEDGLMRVVDENLNHAELEVGPLDAPRVLLFVDAYYPGWRAKLDGQPTDIMLANDAFKAVVVPAGTHRVRFEFRPRRVYLGAGISAGGLAILTALMVACKPKNNSPSSLANED